MGDTTAPAAGPTPAAAPGAAREKLWTRSFLLLWQGQLVSILGDVVYAIALGFWVLAVTGSTALMGALMAASTLPRVLVSPFAGVVVDRAERRGLLIGMDVIRGVAVVAVAFAAFAGLLQVWMVFVAGVVLGLCGAFFSPAVSSVIPDITSRTRVVQANSVFGMLGTGGNIVGNAAGGALFQVLGAPVLFFFNGISYLFSAACLLFAKVPAVVRAHAEQHFFADLASGFTFIWRIRGLRLLLLTAAVLNFFANAAIMLFLPFYRQDPVNGPAHYGVAMAFLTGGMFLGMALTASAKIPPRRRGTIFVLTGAISLACLIAFPFMQSFGVALALLGVAGFCNAILNVFIGAVMQMAVPQEMRGKVFALLGMLTQGLTPIAYALAGGLAAFLPLAPLISASFAVTVVAALPAFVAPSFHRFINFDPEKDTVESVS